MKKRSVTTEGSDITEMDRNMSGLGIGTKIIGGGLNLIKKGVNSLQGVSNLGAKSAVGAGGVGAELINQLRFRDFPRAGTVLVVTIVMVLIVDAISAAIRRRIIKGRDIKV